MSATPETRFTTEQQIEIFRVTCGHLEVKHEYGQAIGICFALQCMIKELHDVYIPCAHMSAYFPLFTKQNALQFGANTNMLYWWDTDELQSRLNFIYWIIVELHKGIQL